MRCALQLDGILMDQFGFFYSTIWHHIGTNGGGWLLPSHLCLIPRIIHDVQLRDSVGPLRRIYLRADLRPIFVRPKVSILDKTCGLANQGLEVIRVALSVRLCINHDHMIYNGPRTSSPYNGGKLFRVQTSLVTI
jgi:hypothetical protein